MDYHIDSEHPIADTLNPLLDTIAGLSPEHARLLEQGCNLVVTLVNDALTAHYQNLMAMYLNAGVDFTSARADINFVFEPVVDLIEERLAPVQDAITAATDVAEEGLYSLIENVLGALLGNEAAESFRADVDAEKAQAEYEAEVEAGIVEAQDFEDWFGSMFPGRSAA